MSVERSAKRINPEHYERQKLTIPLHLRLIPRQKISWSACETLSQKKEIKKIQEIKHKKRCATENSVPIIHSLFPKIREDGQAFIDTIKQLKLRKHSHLLIADIHDSTLLKQYRECKQLMPCATKITKVQQCQFEVKKYLEEINKQRRSSQIINRAHFNQKSLPKLENNSIVVIPKRHQYSVVQLSPTPKHIDYGPNCKKYKSNSKTQLKQKQTEEQDQTLICKAPPFNTMRETKAIAEVKLRLKHLNRIQKQSSNKKNKLKKLPPTSMKQRGDKNNDKGISPWQSYYQGFVDIIP